MKTSIILSVIIPVLLGMNLAKGQGLTPPSPGKAVVYFARVTNYGGAVSFEFFHQDKYIGAFKAKNYIRYECAPGESLFWASSENREFVTAELQEGGTYIILVNVIMGAWKARVGLAPISANDIEDFARAKEMINGEPPVITSDSKIQEMNKKLDKFIDEQLQKYETEWKSTKEFGHISPDMAIPEESMK
jgi:hypothetical protein